MARKNPALESLRQEVKARHRAAGRKVSRLRSKGVELGGTEYDVRRSPASIDRYNSKQLRGYLDKLNSFTDRGTQYVGDAHGRPIRNDLWNQYKALEKNVNSIKKGVFDKIKNIPLESSGGATIGERHKIVTPDRPSAGNPSANPYVLTKRKSKSIKSEGALKKLIEDYENKLKGNFLAQDLATDRRVAMDMTNTLNRRDIQEKLDALSDFHFNILWNFEDFATALSYPYELAKEKINGSNKAWHEQAFADNLEEAVNLIESVKKIKPPRGL